MPRTGVWPSRPIEPKSRKGDYPTLDFNGWRFSVLQNLLFYCGSLLGWSRVWWLRGGNAQQMRLMPICGLGVVCCFVILALLISTIPMRAWAICGTEIAGGVGPKTNSKTVFRQLGRGVRKSVIVVDRADNEPPAAILHTSLGFFERNSKSGDSLRYMRTKDCPNNAGWLALSFESFSFNEIFFRIDWASLRKVTDIAELFYSIPHAQRQSWLDFWTTGIESDLGADSHFFVGVLPPFSTTGANHQ